MKHFQDLGHRVVFVVGDFTAMIGDPTGRSKTRPPLTTTEIERNAETYKAQVFKLLDPVKTVVEFNSRWLIPLGSDGLIKLAANYNVAQMLERREFRQRFEAGPADRGTRVPLSAGAGVRLGRAPRGRRARRHRSALQPERRPRHHAGLRSVAADRDDDPVARGARRRREDVEEPRQLRRRHRRAGRDVRKADVRQRRADVAVLPAPHEQDDGGGAGARGIRGERRRASEAGQGGSCAGDRRRSSTTRTAAAQAAAEFDRVHARGELPSDLRDVAVAFGADAIGLSRVCWWMPAWRARPARRAERFSRAA